MISLYIKKTKIISQQNIHNKYITMRKGFIVRDRSLSSFPSKQLSHTERTYQKSTTLLANRGSIEKQSKIMQQKQQDISKLKYNLDNALKMAVDQAVHSSRYKQQSVKATHTKLYYERKYKNKQQELQSEKQVRMQLQLLKAENQYKIDGLQATNRKLLQEKQHTYAKINQLKKQVQEMEILRAKVKEIQTLTLRIKKLELQIRQQKLFGEQLKKENGRIQKEKDELIQKLKKSKPIQEQLQQRIAYLERVNLQLQRKMQDFYRREHQYKKQIQHYKSSLAKMTSQKNKYKTNYEQTSTKLTQKLAYIEQLEQKIHARNNKIQELQTNLQNTTQKCEQLQIKLSDTVQYYKSIMVENQTLKVRNKALQDFQMEVRRTLHSQQKVAEETNQYIINRNNLVMALEETNKMLMEHLDTIQKKYNRLDKCLQQGTNKGETQIKQSYYGVIRQNDKLKLEKKQLQAEISEKVLKFGQERDTLNTRIKLFQSPIPSDQTIFQAIIHDKTQQILMLQLSNDQLLKIKKQQEQKITIQQKEKEEQKKQIYTLRLKAADLFKAKRQVQQCNKKMVRYQQMIEQQKQSIQDLNQQARILRQKAKVTEQRNFNLDLQNKNQTFKIKQFENIMQQLDVEYLTAKKAQNQKNAHVLTDSIQKMQSGISSLAYYFSCCFCGETLVNPVTLANCGHNYCTKCKEAYSEYCYECDTGQPIEKVYSSKFLREAAGKYKFLLMVVKQAKTNLIKINT